ncbi:hypothetical protein MA4S0726RB_0223 [Mycobacteroides abscessus 4S-0726-RB]|uniref:Uncharacterized protein n=1 Tax=Mycobacteroides abscessus 21 TaxID=1299324 RepID=A0A829Q3W2_9MYCO|nr:hypothetical protein MA4S0726RA_1809 [Mycobacteroides abscessus 4S-0726-RA]EIU00621.1 hypothetical protein MA4S0303_1110 [Mycobacteroides abscessus 4S-0303]EIU01623.1 hypothetical protein MA4S0726RB_0223 [Mycobacteroides abscessus 4S-0726-RB]EIV15366.1 hypothetical protein MA4S0206_0048 [Mycobacteroides abscessus 4S-0206]EIV52028.1 hypothetical protein MA4S0116R_0895 [Mycobacteroides abscessus 4S-0116-R]EIV61753.1 hypothetical protein MA4S0116S_4668 [Mycobacteroides abscessus 4S-0116-S]EUA
MFVAGAVVWWIRQCLAPFLAVFVLVPGDADLLQIPDLMKLTTAAVSSSAAHSWRTTSAARCKR